jgi:hypothetical protein
MLCDDTSTSRACVECTRDDTTNCRADEEGDACVSGHCGCRTSADCGYNYDSGYGSGGTGRGARRICNPITLTCVEDPFAKLPGNAPPDEPNPKGGIAGTDCTVGSECKSGVCTDLKCAASPPTSGTTPLPPEVDPAPAPEYPSSSSSSSSSGSSSSDADPKKSALKEDTIDVPPTESSGCSTARTPSGRGLATWGVTLGLALAAIRRRRRG